MKLKNILYALGMFILALCVEFVGTYAYNNFKYDDLALLDDSELKVHFIDVGQGDAIFLELPNGKTALIDAGEEIYGDTVVSYIKRRNYTKIDYLFATHPHNDHIGGLIKVVNSFDIGSVYMPDVTNNTTTYLNLLKAIENKGKKIKVATAGKNVIAEDDLKLKIVAPSSSEYEELNNYSIVLKLTYKEKSFLFTADAEYDSEMEMLNNYDIKADVLKIGHHGSTSSTNYNFLKKVDPSIAVISVGKDNDYGHPKEKILDKLKERNVKIYRTDLNGNIVITSDGTSLKVRVTNGSNS